MTDSKLLDSSVWLEYLFNGQFKEIIESDSLLMVSSISLFEIKRKLLKEKISLEKVNGGVEFVKERSLVIPLNAEIADKAAEVSLKQNLGAMDALIYTTAVLSNVTFVTKDNDFRGLKNTTVLS